MNIFEWAINNSFNAYYEDCCKVLNLELYHTQASLKEAYHKKVLECHPDKGGNTSDFIKVNEAYKFLSSLNMGKPKVSKFKDSIPNNQSENFSKNKKNKTKISMPNTNLNNNKNQVEKNEKDDKNINKNKIKPKNVTYKLEIELSDAYFGARRIIKLNRNRICKKCSENNQLYISNLNCEECSGKKYSSQLKEVQLIIKPGTYNGCKVTFKGEGEEYVGFEPGDIIFEIFVKENKNYLRKGSDLYIYKNLSIGEFLGIDYILINLFEKVKFYINKNKIIINPGETKTIIGKGFPFFDDNTHRGNLHIKFNVLFPQEINLEQKNIIRNTFEGRYTQYIKNNGNIEINNKNNNIKINLKKINNNLKRNETEMKKQKKNTCAPSLFNFKVDNKKNINKNKTGNNFYKNENSFNKSINDKSINKNFNIKPNINNNNKNEKEKNLNNLEIYDLVKFDEILINKSYFYEKK